MRTCRPCGKRARVLFFGLVATGVLASPAFADTCREWQLEHMDWKIETVRRYLGAAPQSEVDAAVFEVLQREAYLTSCETTLRSARAEMVGWRLVDRVPEEYGSAVLEGVLECAGFDPDLRALFETRLPTVAAAPAPVRTERRRSVGGRYSDPRRR